MIRPTSLTIACALALLASGRLAAQYHSDDRIGTRLDWGPIQIMLYPSHWLGMQLTVETTRDPSVRQMHGFGGGFDPDSAMEWLNLATQVAHPARDPRDPHAALVTPALHSAGGDSIRLVRQADGSHWNKRVSIIVFDSDTSEHPFGIEALPKEVDDLLHGIQREAALSGFSADSITAAAARRTDGPDFRDAAPPVLIEQGRMVYPDHSKRGRIIVSFWIDQDGIPDTTSMFTLYADHPEMTEWARILIGGNRYRPARLHGTPIRILVRQGINYVP